MKLIFDFPKIPPDARIGIGAWKCRDKVAEAESDSFVEISTALFGCNRVQYPWKSIKRGKTRLHCNHVTRLVQSARRAAQLGRRALNLNHFRDLVRAERTCPEASCFHHENLLLRFLGYLQVSFELKSNRICLDLFQIWFQLIVCLNERFWSQHFARFHLILSVTEFQTVPTLVD